MENLQFRGWEDLPAELLLRIISLADDRTAIMSSGVCKGWRHSVCSGSTHLSLSWSKNRMSELLGSLAPKFSKLEALNLRQIRPQLEDEAVESAARFWHELRDLDLSNSVKLSDRSLYAIAEGCPNLARLNISGCSGLSDGAVEYLVGRCRGLVSLNLCGCVHAASDVALKAIARNCRKLEYLNLGWCEGVSDEGVISLAAGCPGLRGIDLCGCVLISDASVIAVAEGCRELRSLGLYFCRRITDRAMYSLAKGRREMEMEGLARLNISQCTGLTPRAVQAVCDSFPGLHTCAGRHSLIISGCLHLTSVHCACALPRRVSLD